MGQETTSNARNEQPGAWLDAEWLQRAFDALRSALDVDPDLKAEMIAFLFQVGLWDETQLSHESAVARFNGNLNPGKSQRFSLAEIWALCKRFDRDALLFAMCDDMGYERPRKKPTEERRQELLERIAIAQEAHNSNLQHWFSELDRLGTTGKSLRVHPAMRDRTAQFSMPEGTHGPRPIKSAGWNF